ncbi:hypothetical protein C8J56DRAFT_1049614 [Mycena floridula]|nr:hypothetical protein C8J56DRAFT_1049614 [Mycena floridula]
MPKSDVFDATNSMELEKDRRVTMDVIYWEHSRARPVQHDRGTSMDSRQITLIDSQLRRRSCLMATKLMDEEPAFTMQLEEYCQKGAIRRLYVQINSGVQMSTPWLLTDQTF